MKKKLTEYDKNRIEWDKRDATIEILLIAFDKPLKYDYTMPSYYTINKMVLAALSSLSLPKYMRDKIDNLVFSRKDEYSELEFHISHADSRFGHEWFFGHGDFYRWRDGEKEKAMERINKYIPKKDMKYYKMVQDYIRANVDNHREY